MDKLSDSKLLLMNGDANKNKNNMGKNIYIPNNEKKICCLFVNNNFEDININKILEIFSSNEYFKTKYLNQLSGNN